MEIRYAIHPEQARALDTAGLRREFLVQDIFQPGVATLVYSHIDRVIVGGAVADRGTIELGTDASVIGSDYLLERREMGVINLGGRGVVRVDGVAFAMDRLDGLYLGKGSKKIEFMSDHPQAPARFYYVSVPAHRALPAALITGEKAKRLVLGSSESANRRTITQVIHPDVVESCSLVMGFTRLDPGSVWNTMPCHTHQRRMEVYLYFELPGDEMVLHLMGQPEQTRHLVVRNEEAVICPSWSIHSGVGTRSYAFVWAMTGENQTFTDMDAVSMDVLR